MNVVHIPDWLDDKICQQAQKLDIPRSQLMVDYLLLGMQISEKIHTPKENTSDAIVYSTRGVPHYIKIR